MAQNAQPLRTVWDDRSVSGCSRHVLSPQIEEPRGKRGAPLRIVRGTRRKGDSPAAVLYPFVFFGLSCYCSTRQTLASASFSARTLFREARHNLSKTELWNRSPCWLYSSVGETLSEIPVTKSARFSIERTREHVFRGLYSPTHWAILKSRG